MTARARTRAAFVASDSSTAEWAAERLEVLRERWAVPGAALAICSPSSTAVATAGSCFPDGGPPVTRSTTFPTFSLGKTLTAAAAVIEAGPSTACWEKGIVDVLPKIGRHSLAKATLLDLLAHTSGMPSYNFFWRSGVVFDRDTLVDDHLPYLPAICRPGTRPESSELMYIVAGQVVERRSGRSWEEILRDLGRNAVGFVRARYTHSEAALDPNASPLFVSDGPQSEWRPFVRPPIPDFASPVGTMSWSVEDLSRVLRFHLESTAMTQRHRRELTRLRVRVPTVARQPGVTWLGYSCGWSNGVYRGYRLLWKSTRSGAMAVLPEAGTGVGVLCSGDCEPFAECAVFGAVERLLGAAGPDGIDRYHAAQPPRPRVSGRFPDPRADGPIGVFRHDGFGRVTLRRRRAGAVLEYGALSFPVHRDRRGRLYAETAGWFPPRVRIVADGSPEEIGIGFEPAIGPVALRRSR